MQLIHFTNQIHLIHKQTDGVFLISGGRTTGQARRCFPDGSSIQNTEIIIIPSQIQQEMQQFARSSICSSLQYVFLSERDSLFRSWALVWFDINNIRDFLCITMVFIYNTRGNVKPKRQSDALNRGGENWEETYNRESSIILRGNFVVELSLYIYSEEKRRWRVVCVEGKLITAM